MLKDVEPETAPPGPYYDDINEALILNNQAKTNSYDGKHRGGNARAPDFNEVLSATVTDED